MMMIIYAAVAIIFLILVIGFVQKPQVTDSDESITETTCGSILSDSRWLDLSERIFDPSDARWVSEELAFPKLAEALIIARKRLAIRWLEALKSSFDEVVRTREIIPNDALDTNSPGSWQTLWLTIRFKLLISYALFVVKVFGPYHRLIPSFSWIPFSQESENDFQRPALADSHTSR